MDVDINSVTGIPVWQNYFNGLTVNPILLIIVVVVIILYIILFGSLGNGNNEISSNGEMKLLTIILVSLFIVLVIINGFNHFLNIDVITRIRNFFTRNPEIDILINNLGEDNNENNDIPINVPEIKAYEEVYHVPGNVYNFNNARALCKAYGGRLANYEEIEKAYNDGGEWCSFGWSEDQMALYPTQMKTWKKLQKIDGHQNDCGRPGINGGFIDNPNVRFGVNCYGHKPKITPLEAQLMKNNKEFPIKGRSQEFEEKVDYWRNRISEIIVSPFNRNSWSRF
tara:strand:+ start:905 stop:1750 length:846 start_codon:yes stop_codon:yes gene_type:complete